LTQKILILEKNLIISKSCLKTIRDSYKKHNNIYNTGQCCCRFCKTEITASKIQTHIDFYHKTKTKEQLEPDVKVCCRHCKAEVWSRKFKDHLENDAKCNKKREPKYKIARYYCKQIIYPCNYKKHIQNSKTCQKAREPKKPRKKQTRLPVEEVRRRNREREQRRREEQGLNEKVTCECGRQVVKRTLKIHKQSNIHKKLMNK
jgi:hypothetical protein